LRVLRRHPLVRVVGEDAGDEFTLLDLARHDGPAAALQFLRRRLVEIEPQPGLLQLSVGTVAGEAMRGQDRQNIASVLDFLRLPRFQTRDRASTNQGRGENDPTVHGESCENLGRAGGTALRNYL